MALYQHAIPQCRYKQVHPSSNQSVVPCQWSEMDLTSYSNLHNSSLATMTEPARPQTSVAWALDTIKNHDTSNSHSVGLCISPDNFFALGLEGDCRTNTLRYPNLRDANVSVLSQGSIYSPMTDTSHVNGTLDEDTHSLPPSSSRKPSATLKHDLASSVEGFHVLFRAKPEGFEVCGRGASAQCEPLATINECTSMHSPTHPAAKTSPLFSSTTPEKYLAPAHRSKGGRARCSTTRGVRRPTRCNTQGKTATRASHQTLSRTSPNHGSDDSNQTKDLSKKERARRAHSFTESRYRQNLKAKFWELYQTLRQTQFGPRDSYTRASSVDKIDSIGEMKTSKHNVAKEGTPTKSDVLTEAISYVNVTEVEMRHMTDENRTLKARVQMLEQRMLEFNTIITTYE